MTSWIILIVWAAFLILQAWLLRTHLREMSLSRHKRRAYRLHAQNWTHGQIAQERGREPREVADWLAEADRIRAL